MTELSFARELILYKHVGLIPEVIPPKFISNMIPTSSIDNVSTCIAQMFSWGMKMHVNLLELST